MPEIGYQTALSSWSELAFEAHEPNPDLLWPLSVRVFDRMRKEDSQVGSVLRAVTLPIRSAGWMIDPAGARPDVVRAVAEDLGLPVKGETPRPALRTRNRFSWTDHLRLALLALPFGHSYFEQVYEFDGDRFHLAKLAWRPPRTISDIKVAPDGGLVGIEQYGIAGQPRVVIPVGQLVAYVHDREGANWLGVSLLRTAYKNWLLKDRLLRAQALAIERNGLGVPVYTGAPPPDAVSLDERRQWEKSEQEAGLKIATGFRGGKAAGASLPHGSELELLAVSGKLPDTEGPIRYQDEQIARAVLAHFLNLGTETGSWALGSTFANFFTQSLNATARDIESVTQQHVIEDFVDVNWGPTEPAPHLICEPIGDTAPATAEAISSLVACGALKLDDSTEDYIRERYGFPIKDRSAVESEGIDEDQAK